MPKAEQPSRREAVVDLVALRQRPDVASRALEAFEWDCEEELVQLAVADALRVLDAYLEGRLTDAEVELWANAIEGRDDVGFDPDDQVVLEDYVFTLANPILTEPLTLPAARAWRDRLTRTAGAGS